MERDIRYITVGLVVAALIAASVAFLVWQAANEGSRGGGRAFVIGFESGVGGLGVGSPVRYMGMRAGTVTGVELASDRVDQVVVRIRVNEQTPVNASTVARIKPQGITGQSYVGLTTPQPTTEAGPARTSDRHSVPVLPGKPSQLDRLLTRLPKLMARFQGVAANAEKLLTAENRQAITASLAHTRQTLANAKQLLGSDNRRAAAKTLDNTAELTGEAVGLTRDTREVMRELETSLDTLDVAMGETAQTARAVREGLPAVQRATSNVARLTQRLDDWMAKHGEDYAELGTRNLRQLQVLLRDARRTSRAVRDLADQLSSNPSQLIYKPAEEGVEIPR